MNLLYTLTFHDSSAEENARHLYAQLRAATAQGTRFPFDCPYEVALANQRSAGGEWLVAVLAMRGIILDDAQRTETIVKLEDWFARSGAAATRGGQTHPADHLKVSSELGLDYSVVESFGTFVGEPGPGEEEKKPEPKPEPKQEPETATPVAPERVPTQPETLGEDIGRTAAPPPPPPSPAVKVSSDTAKGCATWSGGIMIGVGGLVGLLGLLLAVLFAIGQFASDSPDSGLEDFFMIMACFPLPMLIFAAILVGLGIFIIYQTRKQRAAAAPLVS